MSRSRNFILIPLTAVAVLAAADFILRPVLDESCARCLVPVQFTPLFDRKLIWAPSYRLPEATLAETEKHLAAWRTPPAPDDPSVRILVLGDSVPAPDAVNGAATFPYRLAERIGERNRATGKGPIADVINYSVPDYSTFQIFRLLENALPPCRYDILIIAAGEADHDASERSDASWVQYRLSSRGTWRRIAENSGWYRLFKNFKPLADAATVPRVSKIERELLLERMARMAAASGAVMGFTPTDFLDPESETLAVQARSLGVLTVDFLPELKRQEIDIPTIRELSHDPEQNHYRYTEYLLVHRTQTEVDEARVRVAYETGLPSPDSDEMGLFRTPERLNRYGHEYLALLWEKRLSPELLESIRSHRQPDSGSDSGYLPGGVPVLTAEELGKIGKLPEPPK